MTEENKTGKTAEPDAEKQQMLQQKFMEYQMEEQQIGQVQQQLEKLEAQKKEATAVKEAIEDIGRAKAGDEVLVPVSGGIFFRTEMKESRQFLVNVGGGVVVSKDIDGTKALVDEQISEIGKLKMKLSMQLQEFTDDHKKKEEELKRLIED